jgi:NitT/TauT family transport system permease protein
VVAARRSHLGQGGAPSNGETDPTRPSTVESERTRTWLLQAGRRLLRSGVVLTGATVGVIVVWWGAVETFNPAPYLIPRPDAVFSVLTGMFSELSVHLFATLRTVMMGFGLAVLFGMSFGVAMTATPWLYRALYPVLVTSQSIPKIAIAPLLVIWLGFGVAPIVAIAAIIAAFPIAISTVTALREVPAELLRLGKIMGLRGAPLFLKIRFPHALPGIFGGLKIGITMAVIGTVVGEFVTARSGLGSFILVTTSALRTEMTFAGIVLISLMGIALFKSVALVERLAIPWREETADPIL